MPSGARHRGAAGHLSSIFDKSFTAASREQTRKTMKLLKVLYYGLSGYKQHSLRTCGRGADHNAQLTHDACSIKYDALHRDVQPRPVELPAHTGHLRGARHRPGPYTPPVAPPARAHVVVDPRQRRANHNRRPRATPAKLPGPRGLRLMPNRAK